jgi:hypothetical protein
MTLLASRYFAPANVLGASFAMLNAFAPPATAAVRVVTPLAQPTSKSIERASASSSNVSATAVNVRSLIERIHRMADLVEGWDGIGSIRPSDRTIAAAIHFVGSIPPSVAPPIAAAAGDGEISLSWNTDRYFVDVSVSENQSSVFAHVADRSYKKTMVSSLSELPSAVVQAIIEI